MPVTLTITLEPHADGIAVMHVTGRLDFTTAPEAREAFASAVTAGWCKLIVDLSAMAFVDSAGLGAFIAGMRAARRAGGELRLANPRGQATTLLSLTSVDQVLRIHPTITAALAGFS